MRLDNDKNDISNSWRRICPVGTFLSREVML